MSCMCSECVAARGDDMADERGKLDREEISRFIVEARNPDGTLVFPEWGGCWHIAKPSSFPFYRCTKCGKTVDDDGENPDLYTWPSFGILWEGMQAREDWEAFKAHCNGEYWPEMGESPIPFDFHEITINPATFPETIYAWLTREKV